MKRLLYCAIALLVAMACGRQTTDQPSDPQLQFNKDGKFKIVQFTDTHLSYNNREAFDKSVDVIMSIVNAENPDLVVFTGDVLSLLLLSGQVSTTFLLHLMKWVFLHCTF